LFSNLLLSIFCCLEQIVHHIQFGAFAFRNKLLRYFSFFLEC